MESEEGKGSIFYFSLPCAKGVTPETAAPSKPAASGLSRLILVIDDDRDLARVLSYAFEAQGHRVISTQNGREAIELAVKHRPDMITLDLLMPEVDGYTVIKTLRSRQETRHIPIVCVSMETDPGGALSHGADFYLEKPVDIEKLREVAGQVFARTGSYTG